MRTPNSNLAAGEQDSPLLGGAPNWLELTGRIAKGDEAAFALFYNYFFDRLFRYVLVMTQGNDEVCREILQQAMLKVVRYLKPFPSEPMVWSWLTQAAKTSYIDYLRRRKRGPELVTLEAIDQLSSPSTAPQDEDLVLEAALEQALLLLSSDEQHLIRATYYEERSHRETADLLQVTPKAVESKLGRVRQKLRNLLTPLLNHESKP